MLTSKVTSKGQVTIPREIRDHLDIREGDVLIYEVEGSTVRFMKSRTVDREWHRAVSGTLSEEWNSIEDEELFRDL